MASQIRCHHKVCALVYDSTSSGHDASGHASTTRQLATTGWHAPSKCWRLRSNADTRRLHRPASLCGRGPTSCTLRTRLWWVPGLVAPGSSTLLLVSRWEGLLKCCSSPNCCLHSSLQLSLCQHEMRALWLDIYPLLSLLRKQGNDVSILSTSRAGWACLIEEASMLSSWVAAGSDCVWRQD